jgi:hypothetical protein
MISGDDIEAMAPKGFYDWLDETEVWSTRRERLFSDFHHSDFQTFKLLLLWLEAAYKQGQKDG